jgi:hypothetical protein
MPLFYIPAVISNTYSKVTATGGSLNSIMTVPEKSQVTPDADDALTISTEQNEKSHTINLSEIKQPAVISIFNATDRRIKYMTKNFFLQSITKPKLERFQIIETFRESKLFFFGERTKVYTIQGMLIEALDSSYTNDNIYGELMAVELGLADVDRMFSLRTRDQYRWSTSFQMFYDEQLRGTKLVEQNNIAGLFFERSSIIGYPVQLQLTRDTNNQYLVQFQMTWAVMEENFYNAYVRNQYTPGIATSKTLKTTLNNLLKIYNDLVAQVTEAEAKLITEKREAAIGIEAGTGMTDDKLDKLKKDRDAAYSAYLNEYRKALKNE